VGCWPAVRFVVVVCFPWRGNGALTVIRPGRFVRGIPVGIGEEIFDMLRGQWEEQVGAGPLAQIETTLRRLVGNSGGRLDPPG
jgi:hypothetical protein